LSASRATSRRPWVPVAILLVGVFLLAACGNDSTSNGSEGSDGESEPVSIKAATVSASPLGHPYLYVAEVLGFFEEQNLDVEIIGGIEAGTPEQSLETGIVDFSSVSQDSLVPLAAERPDLPLRIFLHEELWVDQIVTLAEFGYETGADLEGKVIGVPEAKDEAVATLLMSAAGVEPGNYEMLVVGDRAPAAAAMERGEVDAFAGTFVDEFAMEQAGYDVQLIDTGNTFSFYNAGFATTTEMIENRPEVVVRFGQAVAKAMIWVFDADTEVILDIVGELEPEAVQDRETATLILDAIKDRYRPIYETRGEGDLEAWQGVVDLYVDLEQLEESYDASLLFTNDFIDQIWDFDVESVVSAAKAGDR